MIAVAADREPGLCDLLEHDYYAITGHLWHCVIKATIRVTVREGQHELRKTKQDGENRAETSSITPVTSSAAATSTTRTDNEVNCRDTSTTPTTTQASPRTSDIHRGDRRKSARSPCMTASLADWTVAVTSSKVDSAVVETAGPGVRAAARISADPPVSRGKIAFPRGGWAQLPGIRYPLINGVAVVSASPGIDVTTAEQLRMPLLEADRHLHATVVDMTRTRFCDWVGLNLLAEAHWRALTEGGGLRLVIPVDGAVARLLLLTGLDSFIPSIGSPEGTLASKHPRPSPGPRTLARQPRSPDEEA